MEHAVFISHALKDKSIADAICAKLEAAEIKCWMAARDIVADEDWTAATRNAIASSRVIVLVLSENANAAPHIERELAHAFYARRTILTFRLAGTIPPRDFLFYLGNLPWLNAVSPPSEKQLDALTARIKGLLSGSTVIPSQGAGKTTGKLTFSNSWIGALQASHYRTLKILKWVAITTCFFAGFWLLWLAFRPAQEQLSLAESHLGPMSQGSNLSPKSSPPPAGGDASASTPTYAYTRFGLWQPANPDSMPSEQHGPPGTPLGAPAQRTPGAAPSTRSDGTPGEQAGVPAALEPKASPLTSARTHRTPHHHRSPSQVAKAQEASRKRDALRRQVKELEAKAQTAQKKAELATRQRVALEAQLAKVKERARRAEMHADLAAQQHGAMEAELKEAEEKAQLAQQNADLAASQRSTLEAELRKAQEEKAQLAQHVADLAASRNGAANTSSQEEREAAEPADEDADLAANQVESGQTQPPNPGQNAKTPPLIQSLNSSVQSTRP
jgi:hypothetical protein